MKIKIMTILLSLNLVCTEKYCENANNYIFNTKAFYKFN